MKRKYITFLSGWMFSVVLFPQAFAATSGTCGENCTWDLVNGTLTISGNGPMDDYSHYSYQPWGSSRGAIKKIVISDGITHIAKAAFQDTGVTEVIIPNSVESIGGNAFCGVKSLKNITIPEGVTSLGGSVFWHSNLESIIIPSSLKSIGSNTFDGASKLTDVYCLAAQQASGSVCSSSSLRNAGYYGVVTTYEKDGDVYKFYDKNGNISAHYDSDGNLLKSYVYASDGSTSIYDGQGKLIGLQGKRILTVDEATTLVSGNKNTFSIKYR